MAHYGGGNSSRDDRRVLERITAPYGFVPLGKKIVEPKWLQPKLDDRGRPVAPPLQDRPFLDGISGTFELIVEAETPIFVRGSKDPTQFFALPDGRYAIPGTSLKGAVRNVVEIASFGRMRRVNDHRYAVRDLQNRELYGQYMSAIGKHPVTGKGELMPLVNAGWLRCDSKGNYSITVCDFAKIEYKFLAALAEQRQVPDFDPGRKQSSIHKYTKWGAASREVKLQVDLWRGQVASFNRTPSDFGRVLSLAGTQEGTLVFTGQPSNYIPNAARAGRGSGQAKHHDFVFLRSPGRAPRVLAVEDKVFRDFEFAHSDRGQQNNLGRSESPNEEWKFWRERLAEGSPVPVFFLCDEGGRRVQSFGLAMMFRLPYRNSIKQALDRIHPAVDDPLDLADGLFGTVLESSDPRAASLALKGRVLLTHAIAEGSPKPEAVKCEVLGSPKASYYPNYVEQDPDVPGAEPPNDDKGPRYTTWQDDFSRPRGWKRYKPLSETWSPQRPTGSGGRALDMKKVETKFAPLPAGTRFVAKVVVHNLRPVELGALLWALDFGGDERARYTLGMARPLGYGRSKLRLAGVDLRRIDDTPADLDAARAAFVAYMTKEIPGWAETPQIEALLQLAQVVAPSEAKYQRLDPGMHVNEFADAKTPERSFVLPPSHRPTGKARMRVQRVDEPKPRREEARGGARHAPPGRGQRPRDNAPSPVPMRPAVSSARAAWQQRKPGETLRVALVELSSKKKWRATVVGHDARGTIEGAAPADAAVGQEHEVVVIQGGDPKNLNLKWKEG